MDDEGSGWAIAGRAPHLWTDRDMDSAEMISEFATMRKVMSYGVAVFHSRLATTGKVELAQVHPLIVEDGQTAVFLNGTLDYPLKTGENDTRIFADDVVKLDLDDPVHFGSVEIMARRCNAKIAIITVNQDRKEHAYIFSRDQWIVTPGGALASNADHLGKGIGWDEMHGDGHDLFRYRITQPGQCGNCYLFGHDESTCEAPRSKVPNAWRNETQRRLQMGRES